MSVIRYIIFNFLRMLFRFLSLIFYPRKIVHKERIPKNTKYVAAANHFHWVDIVYIYIRGPMRPFMVAKQELQKTSRFLRVMYREANIIFVDRDNPSISSVKSILGVLKNNKSILFFAEGTRNKSGEGLLPTKPGAAIFAIKGNAPMLPLIVYKPAKMFRKNYLYVGEPFDMSEFYGKKLTEELTEEANQKMRAHMLKAQEDLRDYVENKRWKKKNRI